MAEYKMYSWELSLDVRIAVVRCAPAALMPKLHKPTSADAYRLLYHDPGLGACGNGPDRVR